MLNNECIMNVYWLNIEYTYIVCTLNTHGNIAKHVAICMYVYSLSQGILKGEKFCLRNPYFYFWHGESTSTASQKSKDLNKVSLLLQDLGLRVSENH